jgi:hypothetical protein
LEKTVTPYVGRLAPSPTGALHLGNVRTFMIAWLRARSLGGRVIMRMEDLDHPRDKKGAAQQAIDVLLDNTILVSADETARKDYLIVTLGSGLKLQLGVSGDMLCGCGGWSCPEFFEAFEAAL